MKDRLEFSVATRSAQRRLLISALCSGSALSACRGWGRGGVRWRLLPESLPGASARVYAFESGARLWAIKRGPLIFHHFLTPEPGGRATAVIVEFADRLWVMDTLGALAYGLQLRAYADSLGRPIERVIFTHEHPDAWLGWGAFVSVPIFATREMATFIEHEAPELPWPKGVALPKLAGELDAGERFVSGTRLVLYRAPKTEAAAILALGFPDQGVFLASDLVYQKRHAYLGLRRWGRWHRALGLLPAWIKSPRTLLLPGHGEPTDGRAVAQMRHYLDAAGDVFARMSTPQEIENALKKQFPDYGGVSLLGAGIAHALARGPV